jgi:hypothetical protein
MDKSDKKEKEPSKYRVIHHGNGGSRTRQLSFILDHWNLFTENREDPILDKKISSAMIGSAYTQSSSALTLRQLFGIWRKGEGIHSCFYDENGAIVNGPLYMVGMGGSVLSGAFVFWGIVPSRGLIVNSNISPEPWKCTVPSNSRLYDKAAKESLVTPS